MRGAETASGADHAARRGDRAAAGVHPQAHARDDDVRRADASAAGADPEHGQGARDQPELHVPPGHDAHLVRRQRDEHEQHQAHPAGLRARHRQAAGRARAVLEGHPRRHQRQGRERRPGQAHAQAAAVQVLAADHLRRPVLGVDMQRVVQRLLRRLADLVPPRLPPHRHPGVRRAERALLQHFRVRALPRLRSACVC